MHTDKELLYQLQQNDTPSDLAFKKLVDLYKERLYWHIRKIVINHDDADDVLQNTFIKAYKNIKGFRGESQLYSWMYRIATNESINFLKKKARMKMVSHEEYVQSTMKNLHSDPYFEGNDMQYHLQKAIATLPQKQQLVFNMKYFDAMKYTAISRVLDTSVGALKASYHLAVKKIEKYIKKNDL